MNFNWFALIFDVIVPAGVLIGMIIVLIKDHRKKKRREKRCHRKVDNWWELIEE